MLRHLNAAQIVIISFICLIFSGAFLLMLPVSSKEASLGFINALFTSTSAVCVTGLSVINVGTDFTFFGQAVLLLLMQIGGFGIMTLSTFILFMLGKRASLRMRDNVSGSFLGLQHYDLNSLIKAALLFTFGFEFFSAFILFCRWIFLYPFKKALWLSVFHSVSAFCNAGFSLFSDSLTGYVHDPVINFTIMVSIIFGGIGFFVIIDLYDTFRGNPDPAKKRISFHTKIVLTMTVLLLVGGTVAFYLLEKNHSLAGLSTGQGMMAALFQSVTSRTAGFNTLDIKHLSNASLFLIMILMFIGGAPGSMAGGIKVTTIGAILMGALSRLRKTGDASWFGRTLPRSDLERSLSLIMIGSIFVVLVVMSLLITELGGIPHIESRGLFMEIMFESVSAFGTVGLSTGVTPGLSTTGRIIIIIAMFVGRMGPLTLVFAMEKKRAATRIKYPQEKIIIG